MAEPEVPESTYTGDPENVPTDAVRLELGKERSLDLITDKEISYNLTRANGNVLLGASFCAESIAGYFAGLADKSMGGSSVSLSQKSESWRKKAAALLARATSPTITPRATSSQTRRPPKFGIGQHDFHSSFPPGMF
jgi:hypothetical protein